MIARLWWKETRTLWPAWPVLFVAGAGLQWVLLASGAEGLRSGSLMVIALCWATLYGLVAASAAFAGEREMGTLGLLDALPVDRKTLWLGKFTFTLASTLGLALVMLALGYLGSTDAQDLPGPAGFLGHFGTLLFETVAWGLLWSALLGNPMVAGALALLCIGQISYVASGGEKIEFISDAVIPIRLVMATLALAASAIVIVWRPLAGWSSRRSLEADAADTPAARATPIRPRPATAASVLMWKGKREGFPVWLGASAAVWGALAWLMLAGMTRELAPAMSLISFGAALVAGVAVFGGETAVGSQRFLLHLGVGPGPIWKRTMRAWGNGLAVTAFVILVMFALFDLVSPRTLGIWTWGPHHFRRLLAELFVGSNQFMPVVPLFAVAADAFAVGTLAGMVFRRRITAGMLALLVWLAIAPLQLGLAGMGMVPPWALLLTPITLLVISRAWAGDWLDARPGPARWLRLAGYLAVPSVVFSTAYIANRTWGIADPGPVPVAAPRPPGVGPQASDTAATYRRLAAEILPIIGMSADIASVPNRGRSPDNSRLQEHLDKDKDLMERIGRAVELPPIRTSNPPHIGAISAPIIGDMSRIAWLLEQRGRGLLKRDDLAGAWAVILAQYRMSRQLTGAVPDSYATMNALAIDRQAIMLALDWAAAGKQTPDLLGKALADLRALPSLPTFGDVLKAEAPVVERTLDLSGAELEVAINGPRARKAPFQAVVETLLLYSPWERERARRVCRAEFKRLIAASAVTTTPLLFRNMAERANAIQRVSPLAARLMSYWWHTEALNRATAGDRGLVQVIALRAWNLTHGGTYPENLKALVPELLDRLPLDPYSGRPFGYLQSKGQKVAALDLLGSRVGDVREIKPGQWILFSVGSDGREGGVVGSYGLGSDDLVFRLP